jgi:hypothetical protein
VRESIGKSGGAGRVRGEVVPRLTNCAIITIPEPNSAISAEEYADDFVAVCVPRQRLEIHPAKHVRQDHASSQSTDEHEGGPKHAIGTALLPNQRIQQFDLVIIATLIVLL